MKIKKKNDGDSIETKFDHKLCARDVVVSLFTELKHLYHDFWFYFAMKKVKVYKQDHLQQKKLGEITWQKLCFLTCFLKMVKSSYHTKKL